MKERKKEELNTPLTPWKRRYQKKKKERLEEEEEEEEETHWNSGFSLSSKDEVFQLQFRSNWRSNKI